MVFSDTLLCSSCQIRARGAMLSRDEMRWVNFSLPIPKFPSVAPRPLFKKALAVTLHELGHRCSPAVCSQRQSPVRLARRRLPVQQQRLKTRPWQDEMATAATPAEEWCAEFLQRDCFSRRFYCHTWAACFGVTCFMSPWRHFLFLF